MPVLTKSDLNRIVGQSYKSAEFSQSIRKAVNLERLSSDSQKQKYDVFLSHSYLDKEIILQVNYFMEEILGLDVYVDWIEDPDLDRGNVTPETANRVREVMSRCSSLVYAVSRNASSSKWMPWELGYSDGIHGRVAVLLIDDEKATVQAFLNQEFVGIYPYIDRNTVSGSGQEALWVNEQGDSRKYLILDKWSRGGNLKLHRGNLKLHT